MDKPENSELDSTSEQATNKAKAVMAKAKSDLKVLQAQFKAEQKARTKAEKALSEAQDTLSVIQTDLEQERRERTKAEQNLATLQNLLDESRNQIEAQQQALAKSEHEKAEARKALENAKRKDPERIEPKPPLLLSESHSGGQRIAFVVRLVVDERGQTMRTEIEHAQSGKKDVFPSFQAQRLADFITSITAPMRFTTPPASLDQAGPPLKKPKLPGPETALMIKDLQTNCSNERGEQGIIFEAYKPFFIQTFFSVDMLETLPRDSRNVPYEISIYAQRVDMRSKAYMAVVSGCLVSGTREYRSRKRIPGLPAGLFHLVIGLKLNTQPDAVKIIQGPFLNIRGKRLPA